MVDLARKVENVNDNHNLAFWRKVHIFVRYISIFDGSENDSNTSLFFLSGKYASFSMVLNTYMIKTRVWFFGVQVGRL